MGEREREGEAKRIKMQYVHVPNPHSECIYYVLQTYTNKKGEKRVTFMGDYDVLLWAH